MFRCSKRQCLISEDLLNVINGNINSADSQTISWRASNYSRLWTKSLDFGYRHKLGALLPNLTQRHQYYSDAKFDFEDGSSIDQLPPFFDYRIKASLLSRISDQENCGASWAYSFIGDKILLPSCLFNC